MHLIFNIGFTIIVFISSYYVQKPKIEKGDMPVPMLAFMYVFGAISQFYNGGFSTRNDCIWYILISWGLYLLYAAALYMVKLKARSQEQMELPVVKIWKKKQMTGIIAVFVVITGIILFQYIMKIFIKGFPTEQRVHFSVYVAIDSICLIGTYLYYRRKVKNQTYIDVYVFIVSFQYLTELCLVVQQGMKQMSIMGGINWLIVIVYMFIISITESYYQNKMKSGK